MYRVRASLTRTTDPFPIESHARASASSISPHFPQMYLFCRASTTTIQKHVPFPTPKYPHLKFLHPEHPECVSTSTFYIQTKNYPLQSHSIFLASTLFKNLDTAYTRCQFINLKSLKGKFVGIYLNLSTYPLRTPRSTRPKEIRASLVKVIGHRKVIALTRHQWKTPV